MSSNVENELLYVEMSGYILTAVIGTILNGIIIVAVRYITRPYVCTKLALHLSTANLFGCLFVIFVEGFGDTWLLRNKACAAQLELKSLWMTSAILMTSFLVYEGIIKLRYQIKQLHSGIKMETGVSKNEQGGIGNGGCLNLNLNFTVALVWAGAGLVGLFAMFSTNINSTKWLCVAYQHTDKRLIQIYYALFIALPLAIIVVLYVYYKRLAQKHRRSIGTYEREERRKVIQREMHYMKSCFRVSHVLVITWLPYVTHRFCLIGWSVENIRFNETAYHMLKLVQWFSYTSCLVQPMVILDTNYQIKLKVKKKTTELWQKLCGATNNSTKQQKEESNEYVGTGSTRTESQSQIESHDYDTTSSSTHTEIQTLSKESVKQHDEDFPSYDIQPVESTTEFQTSATSSSV